MKKIILILLCCSNLPVIAQFVHPGMLHTKADLNYLKSRIQSGQEPWKSAWQQLQNSPQGDLSTARPHVVSHVARGPYAVPSNGDSELCGDGDIAYTMALQWYVTGNKKYARKAIEILNAWSHQLDSVTNWDKELIIGIAGIRYLNAAEI